MMHEDGHMFLPEQQNFAIPQGEGDQITDLVQQFAQKATYQQILLGTI